MILWLLKKCEVSETKEMQVTFLSFINKGQRWLFELLNRQKEILSF